MWLLLAIICMAVALKVASFSFTIALIPAALGCWCFSKSNRESFETFLHGVDVLSLFVGIWARLADFNFR
ncbi:hypothetical protein ACE1BS_08210 [Aeromonas jandaei]